MINQLLHILDHEGIEYDKEDVRGELSDAVLNGRFRWIIHDSGLPIGFFCWIEKEKDGKKHLYIHNLIIFKPFRGQYNLLKLRAFFRNEYKTDYGGAFWHREEKGYARGK